MEKLQFNSTGGGSVSARYVYVHASVGMCLIQQTGLRVMTDSVPEPPAERGSRKLSVSSLPL